MFEKIRKINAQWAPSPSKCIKAADGRALQDFKELSSRWEEYIKDLCHDYREDESILHWRTSEK